MGTRGNGAARDLEVQVVEIKGHCPVYRLGDRFYIREGWKLETERPLCLHALTALLPYYIALARGISPRELGLSAVGTSNATGAGDNNDMDTAYLQCLDPYERTGGGTVVFAVKVIQD